jgi:ATP-dependent DNA ligase
LFSDLSDVLPNYVLENYAKDVKMELGEWLIINPLPAICELKYDGIRVFLFKSGTSIVISGKLGSVFTPKGNPTVFAKIPEFIHAPNRMILDGEYVSQDGLHLFDVLRVDDRDLRYLALEERRKILDEILEGSGLEVEIFRANTVREIEDLKNDYVSRGFEGLIVKNPLSKYGQPNSWLKLKRFDTIDCFVIDFEDTPERRRTGIARSWYVGLYQNSGQVVNIGKVGSFLERVDPKSITIGTVLEVRFQQVTEDKKLRAPFIIRVRHDKNPSECSYSQIDRPAKTP